MADRAPERWNDAVRDEVARALWLYDNPYFIPAFSANASAERKAEADRVWDFVAETGNYHAKALIALSAIPSPPAISGEEEKSVTFLRACASWFRSEAAEATEDRAHWARVYNAENCDKAASLVERQGREIAELKDTSVIDADDRMWKISRLIAKLQDTFERFGDTCVYIRRGGCSWGAVALNRRADDEKHGVFDLQAQHDRDMTQRAEQVQRLITDRNDWMKREHEASRELAEARAALK